METFAGGSRESAVAQPRAPLRWDAAVPVLLPTCPFCSALVGITWDLHRLARHVKMDEGYAAVDCAGCKPHKAKYSKAVIFPTLFLKPCALAFKRVM